jgi:hypothetical protein
MNRRACPFDNLRRQIQKIASERRTESGGNSQWHQVFHVARPIRQKIQRIDSGVGLHSASRPYKGGTL